MRERGHAAGTVCGDDGTSSHTFDLAMRLNGDCPALWAQAHLPKGDEAVEGEVRAQNPVGVGTIQFENGVTVYTLLTPRGGEYETICEGGALTCLNNGGAW